MLTMRKKVKEGLSGKRALICGQVRIKGEGSWCRKDVSYKRPRGDRPWKFESGICWQKWNIHIENIIWEYAQQYFM